MPLSYFQVRLISSILCYNKAERCRKSNVQHSMILWRKYATGCPSVAALICKIRRPLLFDLFELNISQD